jgi:hypothetical protein
LLAALRSVSVLANHWWTWWRPAKHAWRAGRVVSVLTLLFWYNKRPLMTAVRWRLARRKLLPAGRTALKPPPYAQQNEHVPAGAGTVAVLLQAYPAQTCLLAA